MDAQDKTLDRVFLERLQYEIPLYQRRYAWDEEKQWEYLWTDLRALSEAQLDGRKVGPHFLGALIVKRSEGGGDVERLLVVDGQQRLTTLQLVLKAAYDVASELSDERSVARLDSLLFNDKRIAEGDDRLKVRPTAPDMPAFRRVLLGVTDLEVANADSSILEAWDYFVLKIREWVQQSDAEAQVVNRLDALVSALLSSFSVVLIWLDPDEDEQAIFETMNARGTPLSVADLLKNRLIADSSQSDEEMEEFYTRYWEDFDGDDWQAPVTYGRTTTSRIESLIFYWLQAFTRQEVHLPRFFRSITNLLSTRDPVEVASSIHRYGIAYDEIWKLAEGSEEAGKFYYRWNVMEAHALMPMLLWLQVERHRFEEADVRRLLQMLESVLVRRVTCRMGSQPLMDFGLAFIRQADVSEGTTLSDVLLRLVSGTSDAVALECPSDANVIENLALPRLSSNLNQKRIRMLLEGIEDHVRGSHGKTEGECPRDLSIEHLIPKRWKLDDWPNPRGAPPSAAREWWQSQGKFPQPRARLVNSIGNLTLVTTRLNASMSNSPWSNKRKELLHSRLSMNAELRELEELDDYVVLEQGLEMARVVCEIWPHPEDM